MKKNELENIFKSKLADYETPFDVEKGWHDLEPKLTKRKRRRRILLLFFAGSFAIASVLAYNLLTSNHVVNVPNDMQQFKAHDSEQEDQFDNEKIEQSAETRLLQLIEEVDNDERDSPEEENVDSPRKKTNPKTGSNKIKLSDRASLDTGNSLELPSSEKANSSEAIREGQINKEVDFFVENKFALEEGSVSQEIGSEAKSESVRKDLQIQTVNLLELSALQINRANYNLPEKVSLVDKSTDFTKQWSFSLLGGLGMYQNNFRIAEASDNGLDFEKSFLHELESFAIAGKIKVRLNEKWSLSTGLEYFQSNEKFDYSNSSMTSRVVEGTQRIIYNPVSGDSTYVIGPVKQIGNEWVEVINYNKYINWSIPFGLSYSLGNRALQFNPGAGFVFNIVHQKTGKELYLSEVVSSENESLSKRYVGVSVYFEPQLRYNINKSYSFLFSPGVRRSLSDWSVQENISQKPLHVYLFIGFEKTL